jgi:flagellar biosynthetic protein FliR
VTQPAPSDAVRALDAIPLFLLYFLRIGALFTAVPVFGMSFAPLRVRVALGFLLALLLFLAREGTFPRAVPTDARLLPLALREAALGALTGLLFHLVFSAARVAGTFIGQEMGFGMASQVDPITGESVTLTAQVLEILTVLIFFAAGGHHAVLRILDAGLQAYPPGELHFPQALPAALLRLPMEALEFGFRVAGPVLLPLFLVTLSISLLARAVPQMNIMDMAFSLRIGVALLLFPLSIPFMAPAIRRLLGLVQDAVLQAAVGR